MTQIRKVKDVFVALDIDGTIYDSADIVVDAFRNGMVAFFKKSGKTPIAFPERNTILQLVGLPTHTIFTRLFPSLSENDLVALNEECSRSFVAIIRGGGGRLFPGVKQGLRDLFEAGYSFLTASNGREDYIRAILETYELVDMFSKDILFVSEDFPDKKDLVAEYIRTTASGRLLIMVGDRESDRNAAAKNGIPFVGCSFGHAGKSEIEGEPYIADSFDEVPGCIERIVYEYK